MIKCPQHVKEDVMTPLEKQLFVALKHTLDGYIREVHASGDAEVINNDSIVKRARAAVKAAMEG